MRSRSNFEGFTIALGTHWTVPSPGVSTWSFIGIRMGGWSKVGDPACGEGQPVLGSNCYKSWTGCCGSIGLYLGSTYVVATKSFLLFFFFPFIVANVTYARASWPITWLPSFHVMTDHTNPTNTFDLSSAGPFSLQPAELSNFHHLHHCTCFFQLSHLK